MKLSLGPILYYWPEEQIRQFYREIADSAVDIVYLGETICSKRRSLNLEQWIEIGQQLQAAGKEVVLSTLALLEAESELKSLRKICGNGTFLVEANDLAAVNICAEQEIPFVVGHSVNLYNQGTMGVMARCGMKRWVLPVELSKETLHELQQHRPDGVETEVFSWGKIPLAYAARCYTARHYNLPKDDCQYRCLDDPDGILLNTKEGQPFLTINGIQTQSAQHNNLLGVMEEMKAEGVDVVRISPQSRFTPEIVQLFDQRKREEITLQEGMDAANRLLPLGGVDGYWRGEAGIQPTEI
ncbi:MAG: U32 family peptidase [Gammaproteobacteria bacterium]|nr:U32 family peptidase [Gammaproteobacteria bacterium]MBT3489137.1 U32 family peptidase [Gammaproteobacteria bacterium]MBT3845832.1 U32 family peptidase [Gammaproteobacteria bacterium]MBT3893515.1 U32 family peptidase [Gammaproteobacteria bacterium]MBT4300827.1 U32 family peptidase [Gammaproteobacteria bacterium]